MSGRAWWWWGLDVVLLVAAVAGSVLLVAPQRTDMGPPVLKVPSLEVVTNERGERQTTLEMEAWRALHERAGLPEPGEIKRVDPVPVQVMLSAIERWIETEDADAIGEAGEVYLALEHHDAAIRFFAAASALKPDAWRWAYLLGVELQAAGLVEPAIEAFKRAQSIDPFYATLHARLGELLLERSDVMSARQAFEQCVKQAPNMSLGYVGLGRVALVEHDFASARRELERAVSATPNDFRAWRMLSRAYGGLGELERAQEAARRAERLPMYRGWLSFDERLEASHLRARTQRALENRLRVVLAEHRTDEAVAILEELVRRRPQDSQSVAMLAQQHLANGAVAQARERSEQALQLDPGSASIHALKAMVHMTLDEYERAHMALDEAIRRDGTYAPAWELRGRVLLLQNKFDDAAAALRQSIALDGNATGSRYMLAYALAQNGERERAVEQLESLLEIDPGHAAAQQMLQSLRR